MSIGTVATMTAVAMSTTPEGLRALVGRHEAATDWRQDNLLQAREDCGVLLDLLRRIEPLVSVRYVVAQPGHGGPDGPDYYVCDGCKAWVKSTGNGCNNARQYPPERPLVHATGCPVPLLEVLRPAQAEH